MRTQANIVNGVDPMRNSNTIIAADPSAKNLNLKKKLVAQLGSILSPSHVRSRYDVFEVEPIEDESGKNIGYRLMTPLSSAKFHRYAGGQHAIESTQLTIELPSRQFVVDGEPHWPFECLNPEFVGAPAFAEVAGKIADKAFSSGKDLCRYGVIPGKLVYRNRQPVFSVDTEYPEFVMFYSGSNLTGFAGLQGYNMIHFGEIDMALIPIFLAAELVAA